MDKIAEEFQERDVAFYTVYTREPHAGQTFRGHDFSDRKQTRTRDERVAYALEMIRKRGVKRPVLVDKFLDDATELDVDAISDGSRVVIGGIMEHIEEAGVHSGDSACSLPPISISKTVMAEITRQAKLLALEVHELKSAWKN